MNITNRGIGLILSTSVLLLAGCATGYGTSTGGYGHPAPGYPSSGYPSPGYPSPGYPSPGYPSQYATQWQGTVDTFDPRNSRILVTVEDPRTRVAQRLEVRYDQRTRLVYQGRANLVEGLERGDVIRFDATQAGRFLYARQIEVVRNVRDGGGYGGAYGNDLRGSVALVDPRARVIRLDGAGYGNDVQLGYDARTTVDYQGRSYRPENLQRGDIVRIQARRAGNGQWLAERIIVERSVGR
jgi:hypothetical protein